MNAVNATQTKRTPRPQRLRGMVVGAKSMKHTIRVSVERLVWHPKIHRQYRVSKTFLVHDPKEEAQKGDRVVIEQMRKGSKRKFFRLVALVTRAKTVATTEEEVV